eukprot:CAMPEP_0177647424 /NCGR_PEP_ID=MMETSP0447-20121125/10290_1 /TAXON_ID=0 /ORGANISM="Stygamoeba regulata, Strain BSH-02190019" /LENGTH=128 /DNA_ID=CAMNT_0019150003 /DNA_START=147 /DNA_END=533 /DNA_ORIENTATION=+
MLKFLPVFALVCLFLSSAAAASCDSDAADQIAEALTVLTEDCIMKVNKKDMCSDACSEKYCQLMAKIGNCYDNAEKDITSKVKKIDSSYEDLCGNDFKFRAKVCAPAAAVAPTAALTAALAGLAALLL